MHVRFYHDSEKLLIMYAFMIKFILLKIIAALHDQWNGCNISKWFFLYFSKWRQNCMLDYFNSLRFYSGSEKLDQTDIAENNCIGLDE